MLSDLWNKTFDDFLQEYGLVRCINDPCAYVSKTIDELVILVLYVDDGLIACSSKSKMDSITTHMNHAFEITVTDGSYYVGLDIERDRKSKTISIHCYHYIQRLLSRFRMEDCKPCKTPGEAGLRLSKEMVPLSQEEKEEMERNPYREAVGSLMYAAYTCRPDIAFNVAQVAQFASCPGIVHWKAVKRIMRYLKGSSRLKIIYGVEDLHQLTGFVDADFAGEKDNSRWRSMTGLVFALNGGPVVWTSRVQKTVAISTVAAEFMALKEAVTNCIWLRNLLQELGFCQDKSTVIHSDNQGAIKLVLSKELLHRRTKYFAIDIAFVRDQQENRVISVEYLPTEQQPVDMLTKSVSSPSLVNCLKKLDLN